MSHVEPPPSLDYAGDGWANTGRIRLRSSWFGFAVVEELYARRDGTQQWRPLVLPKVIVNGRVSVDRALADRDAASNT